LKFDVFFGQEGRKIYSIKSTDSALTWSAAEFQGFSDIWFEAFSPNRNVLHLFATRHMNSIWFRTWDHSEFMDWQKIIDGPETAQPSALVMSECGAIDIFYVDHEGRVLHRLWRGRSRETSDWSPKWEIVSEILGCKSMPVAVARGRYLLDLFIVGTDRSLYWKPWVDLQWKSFKKLGEDCVGHPVAVARHRERIDVFILNAIGELLYKTWNGSGWEPPGLGFENLGGAFVSEPAAIARSEDSLDLFIVGKDKKLYHRALRRATWQPADGFNCLGGNFADFPPTITISRDGLDIFLVGGEETYNGIYHKRWDGIGVPSSSDFRPLHQWQCTTRVAAIVREQDSIPKERDK
jgi:hypothetical protein